MFLRHSIDNCFHLLLVATDHIFCIHHRGASTEVHSPHCVLSGQLQRSISNVVNVSDEIFILTLIMVLQSSDELKPKSLLYSHM